MGSWIATKWGLARHHDRVALTRTQVDGIAPGVEIMVIGESGDEKNLRMVADSLNHHEDIMKKAAGFGDPRQLVIATIDKAWTIINKAIGEPEHGGG